MLSVASMHAFLVLAALRFATGAEQQSEEGPGPALTEAPLSAG